MSSWLIELPTVVMTCKGSVSAAYPPGPRLGQQPCPPHTLCCAHDLTLRDVASSTWSPTSCLRALKVWEPRAETRCCDIRDGLFERTVASLGNKVKCLRSQDL